mmetsp:Transcript_27327/g.46392  ORF Transcript_27327/g.46392 Transcript_27327/m.46392 type:complete len:206 (-) Transcript_27327:308-925(-)
MALHSLRSSHFSILQMGRLLPPHPELEGPQHQTGRRNPARRFDGAYSAHQPQERASHQLAQLRRDDCQRAGLYSGFHVLLPKVCDVRHNSSKDECLAHAFWHLQDGGLNPRPQQRDAAAGAGHEQQAPDHRPPPPELVTQEGGRNPAHDTHRTTCEVHDPLLRDARAQAVHELLPLAPSVTPGKIATLQKSIAHSHPEHLTSNSL